MICQTRSIRGVVGDQDIPKEKTEIRRLEAELHFQDPTGAHLAIFKPGEHPGTIERGPGAGKFGWAELQTGDTGKAKAFYTELFGWGAKEDSSPGVQYTEFQVGGESIAGMMPLSAMHGDAPPNWMPYVQVDDCHATANKATQGSPRFHELSAQFSRRNGNSTSTHVPTKRINGMMASSSQLAIDTEGRSSSPPAVSTTVDR